MPISQSNGNVKSSLPPDFFGGWWFPYPAEFIDAVGPHLGPIPLAIFHRLLRHSKADGRSYPSYQRIADDVGMDRRTAIRYMKVLLKLGLVTKVVIGSRTFWQLTSTTQLLEKGSLALTVEGGKRVYKFLPPSVQQSPRLVTNGHSTSDQQSPPSVQQSPRLVTNGHSTSDQESPEEDTVKKRQSKNNQFTYNQEGGEQSASPPPLSPELQALISSISQKTGSDRALCEPELSKAAIKLLKAGYTSKQVDDWPIPDFYTSSPTIKQVLEGIGQIRLQGTGRKTRPAKDERDSLRYRDDVAASA